MTTTATTATQPTTRTAFNQIQRALEQQGKFFFSQKPNSLKIIRKFGKKRGGIKVTCTLKKQERSGKLSLKFGFPSASGIAYLDFRDDVETPTRNFSYWSTFFEAFKKAEVIHMIDLKSIRANPNCKRYTKKAKDDALEELLS